MEHISDLRTYDKETTRILEEAKLEYAQKKQKGYTREQAFQDFLDAQEELHRLIRNK